MPIHVIATGTKHFGNHGDAWLNWCLLRGVLSDEEIEAFCCERGAVASYSGPGLSFADAPCWLRSKGYTLIKQRCGYDV